MIFQEILQYLTNKNLFRYQKEHFDDFIKKVGLNFILPGIHVTGSNGKSSVCHFLSDIYQQKYRVGMFISPMVESVLDMIQINSIPINKDAFASIFNNYYSLINQYDLSEFEIITFIAFVYFKEQKCDLCIIEVGMGGILDATNIFVNKLSIITSISLEHTAYLGRTESEIAYNKAQIIKPNTKVILGHISEEATRIIYEIAKKNKSVITQIREASNVQIDNKTITFDYLPLHNLSIFQPSYQITNAAIAIEAIKALEQLFNVSDEEIKLGLLQKHLPLRFERIKNIILDGAHNPEAIQILITSLDPNEEYVCLFAAFKDKNIEGMLTLLHTRIETIILTTFDHIRARTIDDYFLYLDDFSFTDNYMSVINEYLNQKNITLLITGSLAFVSLIRKRLNEK